jgi:hypothetical protein
MLAATLRHLDENGKPDERVYAFEKPSRKSRTFHIMTAEQAWKMTCANRGSSHIYEVLSGPCDLYLDIEWMVQSPPPGERSRVEVIVEHVLSCLRDTYGKVQDMKVTLASASGDVKGRYKCSWHAHISSARVCWANAAAVGQFVRNTCSGIPEVDKVPYAGKGQNWRCVGSSKATDPTRKLAPVDHQTFLGCTVQQPVDGRSLVYPVVDVPCALEVPVPPYIAALASTLHAGGEPIMCGPGRCVVPFRELQVCEHVGRKHRSNHQYAVINTGTLMWKMNCHSCSDAISVWRAFDPAAVGVAFEVQRKAYSANAMPPPTLQPGLTPTCMDMGTHGPPPAREGVVVQCVDGIYGT